MTLTLDDLTRLKAHTACPTVVYLCGATQFWRVFQQAIRHETREGKLVLNTSISADTHHERTPQAGEQTVPDDIHRQMIDLADEVLVLNVGGSLDEAGRRAIAYAVEQGKRIRWLDLPQPPFGQQREEELDVDPRAQS